jgi:hypothetical protein
VADTYADQSQPNKNSGSAPSLFVDNSPVRRAYLRFNLQGITGTVVKATLRVYANSASATGYEVHGVTSQTWNEYTLTFANAPAVSSAVIGSSNPFAAGTWTSVDVTPFVVGRNPGDFSLALIMMSPTAVNLASRETGSRAPQLIILTQP